MRKTPFFILLCFVSSVVFGQISTDERPPSFDDRLLAALLNEQKIDSKTMPRLDMTKIQEEDEIEARQNVAPRFGFPHDVSFNLNNSGIWTVLPNGDRVWRLNLYCPGALSINLLYDDFHLPKGAKLFIYSENKEHYIGAFTEVNNKGTGKEPIGFATGLLYGEVITLEYYLPGKAKDMGVISIARVVHGYRYIQVPDEFGQSLASSGGCQVNVNCPEGANWQQEKNAVALILVNGNRECTGSLVNTTCNDDRPLFLTANHCLDGGDAVSNPNLTNWSFYWHYESPTCSGTWGPTNLSTTGATVVANNANTDFALLQLTEDPKNRNGVIPYYLGWDRSGSSGSGGVGIHHPQGDVKKIATYTGTPISATCLGFLNANFWQTGFVATVSGHSVIERISSGSPLINSNRKVIGQLLGVCEPAYFCDNPSLQEALYGKFSVSWTGGGATDNRRRLSDWLDPLGIAGNTLDGKVATQITGPDYICISGVYSIADLPSGATVTGWSADPSSLVNISGSGTSVTVSKVGPYTPDPRPVTLYATLATDCGTMTVQRQVSIGTINPNITDINISGGPGHEGYFCEHAIGFNTYELVLNPSGPTDGPFVLELLSYPGGAVLYSQEVNLATGILPFTAGVGTYTLRARGLHPCGPDDWKSELVQFVHCSEP